MFMGNLRSDKNKSQLAQSIINLFKHFLKFKYIKYEDIEVKGKGRNCKHVLITLRSEDDFNEAYNKLGSFESRKQLGFNFLKLVDPSKQLIVDRKRPPKIVKNSPPKSKNSQPVASVEERKNSPQNIRYYQPVITGEEKKNSPSNIKYTQPDGYREGELLGNETRNTEFKEGVGEHYIKKNLKDHVSKYMSGFLNSSQQGTLFIGVKDDG